MWFCVLIFYTIQVLQSGLCVDSCFMHNYVIILCKMNFRYLFFFPVSLKPLFVSKSTEKKRSEMLPYLLARIFCCTFCYFLFILHSKLVLFAHTLLLNITRSHVLLFVLFAVASNSSSTHQNEMLVPFPFIRIIFPRCTL